MSKSSKILSHRSVFIVDGARTPFLKMRGVTGPFSAADLAVGAGQHLIQRYFAPNQFDEVIIGCAGPAPEEANIARIIALRLGCSNSMPAWTVQRNCASGLQSIDSAYQNILTGRSDLVLAGGTEAMSRAPLLLKPELTNWLSQLQKSKTFSKKILNLFRLKLGWLIPDVALLKGLTDPVVNLNMGQTAEELAYRFHITRQEMDEFAVQSHHRVIQGQISNNFEEMTSLFGLDGTVYEQDDGVRADTTLEALSRLKPVFEKYGNITAGNSSQISDGAALVILASEDAVRKFQLPVLAKIKDIHWAALDPSLMGLGPVHAITPLMIQHALTFDDIDMVEINEAFAAQVIACLKAWQDPEFSTPLGIKHDLGEIDMEKLNPHGGAIAIGHPVGASGARLVLHCAKMIHKNDLKRAIASLCIGGGQGGAILLEHPEGA